MIDCIKLSFGGDIMCLKEETCAIWHKFGRLDYASYVCGLKECFARSDFRAANLETPIDDDQEPTSQSIRFNTPSEILSSLKDVGFDFFSTANNHCLDRGIVGAVHTLDALDRFGFAHDGTYRTESEASKIFLKEIGGVKVAIVSCTYGTNSDYNGEILPKGEEWRVALTKKQNKFRNLERLGFNPDEGGVFAYITDAASPAAITNSTSLEYMARQLKRIRKAKEAADIVIVMPHLGGQYNPGPAMYTKWAVEQIRQAGADVVVAGHSHTPQRCEMKDECLIAYSLGNLLFTPNVGFFVPNVFSEYGIVLYLYINKSSKKLARVTFDVMKCVVGEDGCTRTCRVCDLIANESNLTIKDRLEMENEAVVNRFRGRAESVVPQVEYVCWDCQNFESNN